MLTVRVLFLLLHNLDRTSVPPGVPAAEICAVEWPDRMVEAGS